MRNTTITYEIKVFTDKGWQVADIPKSAVTRADHIRHIESLRAVGVDACLYTITTTVDKTLIYSTVADEGS